ncbi:MAG: SurA N-terminal domain-containing protein [Eubacterium sp.]|nr:SurA N-terminal domain-containing protein [Eubacterium sp.]
MKKKANNAIMVLAVVICLAAGLFAGLRISACSSKREQAESAEAARSNIIAEVYGHKISEAQERAALAVYVNKYNMSLAEVDEEPVLKKQLEEEYLKEMIMDYAIAENAERYGYTYTDEEKQKFEDEYKEFLDELDKQNKKDALEEGISEEDYEKDAELFRLRYFTALGYASEEQYREYREAEFITDSVEKMVEATATVDDDAIKAYYDGMLEAGETSIVKNYTFTIDDPAITLYCDDGYRYVKSLLLAFPSASVISNAEYYTAGDTAKLQSSIKRDVAYMEDRIQEIRDRIDAGEDFDKLIEEYGEDAGMKSEPMKGRGYIAVVGDTSLPDTYREACESLTDTEMVAECATYKGYWFLQASEIVDEGPMPFDEIKSELTNELTAMKQHLQFTETSDALFEELVESGDIVCERLTAEETSE